MENTIIEKNVIQEYSIPADQEIEVNHTGIRFTDGVADISIRLLDDLTFSISQWQTLGKSKISVLKNVEIPETQNAQPTQVDIAEKVRTLTVQKIKDFILTKDKYEHDVKGISMAFLGVSLLSTGDTGNLYVRLSTKISTARWEIQREKDGKFKPYYVGDGTVRYSYVFEPNSQTTVKSTENQSFATANR